MGFAVAARESRRPSLRAGTRAKKPAVGRMQAKLTVGPPNDRFEQEADRVADRVMRMPDSAVICPAAPTSSTPPAIQRLCAACAHEEGEEIQRKCAECEAEEERVQRQEADEEEELIQSKREAGRRTPAVTPAVASDLARIRRRGGRPLSASTRAFLEPRFGRDFSAVRVHTGDAAGGLSRRLKARAFTVGNHVFFGRGEYRPQTSSGLKLLAHELTHTVQQSGGGSLLQRKPLNENGDAAKAEDLDLNSTFHLVDDPQKGCGLQIAKPGFSRDASLRTTESALGQTLSTIEIDYNMECDSKKCKPVIGCATLRQHITLLPSSSYEKLYQFAGFYNIFHDRFAATDVTSFCKECPLARAFATEKQTFEHERMHVLSFRKSASTLFKKFVKDRSVEKYSSNRETAIVNFLRVSNMFWSQWGNVTEKEVISHEDINMLDCVGITIDFRQQLPIKECPRGDSSGCPREWACETDPSSSTKWSCAPPPAPCT